jgi:hypothetical protein
MHGIDVTAWQNGKLLEKERRTRLSVSQEPHLHGHMSRAWIATDVEEQQKPEGRSLFHRLTAYLPAWATGSSGVRQ